MDALNLLRCALTAECDHPSHTPDSPETLVRYIVLLLLFLLTTLQPRVKKFLEDNWRIVAVAAAALIIYLLEENTLALAVATATGTCLLASNALQARGKSLNFKTKSARPRTREWKRAHRIVAACGFFFYFLILLAPHAETLPIRFKERTKTNQLLSLLTQVVRTSPTGRSDGEDSWRVAKQEWTLFLKTQESLRHVLSPLDKKLSVGPALKDSATLQADKKPLPPSATDYRKIVKQLKETAEATPSKHYFVVRAEVDPAPRSESAPQTNRLQYEFTLLTGTVPSSQSTQPRVRRASDHPIRISAPAGEREGVFMVGSVKLALQMFELVQLSEEEQTSLWTHIDNEFRNYDAMHGEVSRRGGDWPGAEVASQEACLTRTCVEQWTRAYVADWAMADGERDDRRQRSNPAEEEVETVAARMAMIEAPDAHGGEGGP